MANSLSVTSTLKGNMAFEATAGSGHSLVLDVDSSGGGSDLGFRPMEMLLMGLAGCTGMDVISILRKMHQEVTSYQVRAEGDRAEEHPRVYTHITVEHIVKGSNLEIDKVRRAVELSATRFCPASAMLGKAAQITHSYRMIDSETDTEQTGTL